MANILNLCQSFSKLSPKEQLSIVMERRNSRLVVKKKVAEKRKETKKILTLMDKLSPEDMKKIEDLLTKE